VAYVIYIKAFELHELTLWGNKKKAFLKEKAFLQINEIKNRQLRPINTYSLIYSALTAIPAIPVQRVSNTTDISNFAFRRLGNFFIDISPVNIFMLIILNTIANRSKIIAIGIDGAAVTLVSAQHTNYFIITIIPHIYIKGNRRYGS
jgi:hypothetical protein